MSNSTKATDYDLTNGGDIVTLLMARTEYFTDMLNMVLGTEELEDNVAVVLGVILGSQIAGEATAQTLQTQINELKTIVEQQSAEILKLGATA